MIKQLVIFFILIFLITCCSPKNNNVGDKRLSDSVANLIADVILPKIDTVDDKTDTSFKKDSFEINESLYRIELLKKAYSSAQILKHEEDFNFTFYSIPPDGSATYHTTVSYNNIFTEHTKDDESKLLQITIQTYGTKNYYFFKLEKDSFKYVFKYESDDIVSNDTLMDINGDSYKDLVIHLRSMGGCCRADAVMTFLYLPETGKFTNCTGFMNPTFYPKEGVVRGVEYGHRGETPLYKMKWNGHEWEPVEYIQLDYSNPKQFIKTPKEEFRPTKKDGIVLKKLPKEYLTVSGLDVALGKELRRVLSEYKMLDNYPNIKEIVK